MRTGNPSRWPTCRASLPLIGAAVHEVRERRGKLACANTIRAAADRTRSSLMRRRRGSETASMPAGFVNARGSSIASSLARHGTKPADRQAADGVERLPLLLFQMAGPCRWRTLSTRTPVRFGHLRKWRSFVHRDEDPKARRIASRYTTQVSFFQKWNTTGPNARASPDRPRG